MSQGGKRKGAGRPPYLSPALKKRAISIRLPGWLIAWMDAQPGTNRALLIEEAIKRQHKISSAVLEKNNTQDIDK